MHKFDLQAKFKPTGDQPTAIKSITDGIKDGLRYQTLLGVTGSGKTFTMANIINNLNRPALVLAHNKTLAAQLANEFREFFPNNRVEYFVSYYDYYQPEAYMVSSDTYIEKDMSINDEIDKLRHSATCSLFERRDVIIVASVSCIYGLGKPDIYKNLTLSLRPGDLVSKEEIIKRLIGLRFTRNEIDFKRATFRSKGDVLDIIPANHSELAIRVEFFGDEIENISEIEVLTGRKLHSLKHAFVLPASHYAVEKELLEKAYNEIKRDAEAQVEMFKAEGKLIEAQRIKERTFYDLEMMRELGYCNGIENYSRYFDGRQPGETPYTLLDYFPNDFVMFIDESHMTIPQVRGMFAGDFARKQNLVNYGFRLPSAFDNRPLNFEEFEQKINQMVFVSATPAKYEEEKADNVAEQIIRPTGLLDPEITVKPIKGQIDDLITEINATVNNDGRVLVTTLTKKMAESLTAYLTEHKIRVRYLHSDIDTLERIEILNGLRIKEFDVLVGINLLREGLDLPEVKLVAILDADKEGFLRSKWSLIQTIGRAARNSEAKVIMYADKITNSMDGAISETNRRRTIQDNYNKLHGITPKTIIKEVRNTLEIINKAKNVSKNIKHNDIPDKIAELTALMEEASRNLEFENAILLRNEINELKKMLIGTNA